MRSRGSTFRITKGGRQLHVILVDHTGELGGAELAVARLLDALDPSIRITVVLFADGPFASRLRSAGREVRVVPLAREANAVGRHDLGVGVFLRSVRDVVSHTVRVARLLRSLDADLVQTTSMKAHLLVTPLRPILGVPLVWHVHDRIAPDYLSPTITRVVRVLARVPRALIANSAATAATLPARANVVVAPPGLAASQIRISPRPHPLTAPMIAVIGRISETKDQLTFVRAAGIVAGVCSDARFLIVGSPAFGAQTYAELVAQEIERLGLGDRVFLSGFVDDTTPVLDRLAIAVHTSGVPEPFGQVVTEAMARGVPVVATSGGGIDEIMDVGSGSEPVGWLVPPRNPQALAAAISAALGDPDEAERRGTRGWERAKTRYNIGRTVSTIEQLWFDVASGRC